MSDTQEPMPLEELKEKLLEKPEPPADADPGSAGSIAAHMDHVISQATTVKKLLYGGAAASVIRRDIAALLAQMDRDLHTARRANNQLAPGEVMHPASWRKSE